ncbi:MAG: hypothetical protein COA96_01370 [SAR86 cluster bacterium]|uniref:Uncharacterized protein n=1 Tax=SAR86 cluster bacterium TaxID=2030880 RepID=A0A2A5BAZ3_9GAMM|nr:MAG: hypothetical protein COA96_01370 [SAR86 cluster bacterium]
MPVNLKYGRRRATFSTKIDSTASVVKLVDTPDSKSTANYVAPASNWQQTIPTRIEKFEDNIPFKM